MVETDPPQRPEFAVDDPARLPITRAVLGSIVLAAVFWVVIETTKERNVLYLREPWQDDPYDAIVSFMLSIVPFWTTLCLLRLPFCVPSQPLSVKRALDLVRALRFQVVLIATTLAAEWISVILVVHKEVWNLTTAGLIAVLAGLSVLTAVAASWLHQAQGSFSQQFTSVPSQPDWIADVLELGERIAAHLGSGRHLATLGLRLLDRFIATPLRIHPLWTTGSLSLLGGTLIALPQIILEGYPATLALDMIAICATSLFAFLVLVGAKLQIPEPHHRPTPRSYAVLLASLAVPLAATFRTTIWTAVGISADDQKIGSFTVLVLGAGLSVGILVFVADSLLRRLHPSP